MNCNDMYFTKITFLSTGKALTLLLKDLRKHPWLIGFNCFNGIQVPPCPKPGPALVLDVRTYVGNVVHANTYIKLSGYWPSVHFSRHFSTISHEVWWWCWIIYLLVWVILIGYINFSTVLIRLKLSLVGHCRMFAYTNSTLYFRNWLRSFSW